MFLHWDRRRQRPSSSYWLHILLALLASLFHACAAGGNRSPKLINLQDQQLVTNRNFQFDVTAYDDDNDPIEFEFSLTPSPPTSTVSSGGIPTLQKVSDYNAVFSWTPGNADVGTYALTVIVMDNQANQSQETINLDVVDAGIGGTQWGRFTEPVGEAAVLNLDEVCFETTVAIQADQLAPEEIDVILAPPSPVGATLVSDGLKRYRLTWCPQPEEVTNQVNFPFILRASTTRGFPPIEKRFLIRLRSETSSDCPGAAPTLTHVPQSSYRGINNLEVNLEVTDDIGVKSAPTLFYQQVIGQANEQSVGPLSEEWNSVVMIGEGEGISNVWAGMIPAIPQSNITIFYRFLVSDDDDPDGVACDHNVESEVFTTSYQWDPSIPSQGSLLCTPCVDDLQCGGMDDHCLIAPTSFGGVCGQSCGSDQGCPDGYRCQEETSVNNVTLLQCVSETTCGVACLSDRFEAASDAETNNNIDTQGTPLMSGVYDMLSICGGDNDHYILEVPAGQSLTARIEFIHSQGDLDLKVRPLDPMSSVPSRHSAGVSDFEEVRLSCVPQDTMAIVKAYGYEGAQNQYSLSVTVANMPCQEECEPDQYEVGIGNNTIFDSTFIDLNQIYEGRICPQDVDVFGLQLEAGIRVEAKLEHRSNDSDLDFEILNSNNDQLAFANAMGRDIELLEFTPTETDEYYFKVFNPRGMGNVSYRFTVRGGASLCAQSVDCPIDQYCNGSSMCVPSGCESVCEAGHSCVSPIAGRLPRAQDGRCAPNCESSDQCRDSEACKSFENFADRCAPSGDHLLAQGCMSFTDCMDDMICLPAPGGYCAAAGCSSDSDCSSDTICETIGGIPACLKRCSIDADCGRSDLRCESFVSGSACIP